MDDAKTFCRNELRKRGNPPQVELEDATQEWAMAAIKCDLALPRCGLDIWLDEAFRDYHGILRKRIEKKKLCQRLELNEKAFDKEMEKIAAILKQQHDCCSPMTAVANYIQGAAKEWRTTDTSDKMDLWPDQERDGISDEEMGTFLEVELEIEQEQQAILWAKASRALEELPGLVPDELPAIRMHFGLDCEPMSVSDIAVALHKTEQQAEYLISRGIEHLRLLVTTQKVALPLFAGESDEVRAKIETYRRKETGRFKRQETDLFAA